MFKKFLALVSMSVFLYVPSVKAAVTVDWVVLTAALVGLLGEARENPAVTDTSLRSICIHALNGDYYSIGADESIFGGVPDDEIPDGVQSSLGFDLHMCISLDTGNSPAFDKVCAKKLKYNPLSFSDGKGSTGVYLCTSESLVSP